MALWEQVLLGVGGVLLLLFFWPGVKAAMEQSKAAENPDWSSVLIPIVAVILFVILLISLARTSGGGGASKRFSNDGNESGMSIHY